MKKIMKSNYVVVLLATMILAGCDRLDMKGMLFSSGTHTEDRVQQWLEWNDLHPDRVVEGVDDEYCIYVTSDIHITDSAPRVELFLRQQHADMLSPFAIINGDIANERGEDPFRVLDSIIRLVYEPGGKDSCYVILGNHDIYFDCQQYFQQYFHTSTYTVTVVTKSGAKDLFVFLDSGNATHGLRQRKWLEEVLAKRDEYRHVIVNTHTSLFRNSYDYSTTPAANLPLDEEYELKHLFDTHRVTLCLMGHWHHQELHQIGTVQYIMTDNMNEDVDAPNYLVVRLGDEMNYKFVTL